YYGLRLTFLGGMSSLACLLLAVALMGNGQASPKQGTTDKELHYAIVPSGEHVPRSGKLHEHTFLLNEKTGQVWQMVCLPGHELRFRKTEVEGLSNVQPPAK